MKKNCLLLSCLFQFTFMIAQVGVGTITPEAALVLYPINVLLLPVVFALPANPPIATLPAPVDSNSAFISPFAVL